MLKVVPILILLISESLLLLLLDLQVVIDLESQVSLSFVIPLFVLNHLLHAVLTFLSAHFVVEGLATMFLLPLSLNQV